PLAAAAARPRPRLRGRLLARRRQRAGDEPLGPPHAAAGGLRAGPRARARLPVRPAVPPGAVVPRIRWRRASLQLARPDGLLPLAPVRAAAEAGNRRVHQGRAARPAVDPVATGPGRDRRPAGTHRAAALEL